MQVRYELGITTSGEFEVCAFEPDADGTSVYHYSLRRHVQTIEDAAWLIRMPLAEARLSWLGQ